MVRTRVGAGYLLLRGMARALQRNVRPLRVQRGHGDWRRHAQPPQRYLAPQHLRGAGRPAPDGKRLSLCFFNSRAAKVSRQDSSSLASPSVPSSLIVLQGGRGPCGPKERKLSFARSSRMPRAGKSAGKIPESTLRELAIDIVLPEQGVRQRQHDGALDGRADGVCHVYMSTVGLSSWAGWARWCRSEPAGRPSPTCFPPRVPRFAR